MKDKWNSSSILSSLISSSFFPLLVVIALFAANYPFYRSLVASRAGKDAPKNLLFLPRAASVKSVKFGYEGLLSDLLWLKSIAYVHSQLDYRGPGRYRQLQPLYDTITDLDPYFIDGYRYGAIFLSVLKGNHDAAIALLKKGLAVPQIAKRWELNYDLGAIYFLNNKDFETAARYFKAAALDDDAPAFVPHVAAYFLRVTTNEFAVSISLWQPRLQSKNEEIRRIARIEIDKLHLEQDADFFKQLMGRYPSDLKELLKPPTPDILAKLPDEWGRKHFERNEGRPPKDRAEWMNKLLNTPMLKELPKGPNPDGQYVINPKTGKVDYAIPDKAGK